MHNSITYPIFACHIDFSFLGVDIFIEKEHFGRALKVFETESQPLPLTLESFYLTYLLYTLGLVAATAAFLYEMYFKKTLTGYEINMLELK